MQRRLERRIAILRYIVFQQARDLPKFGLSLLALLLDSWEANRLHATMRIQRNSRRTAFGRQNGLP
jgi:hypothetical protein